METAKTDKMELFRRVCREHHLSMTPQRRAIYEILIDSDDHPCTEEVFERVRQTFPDIAIDTVYRTLTTFSEMDLVDVVEGYGEAKRYDPDVGSHHHFRCLKCNRIVDFRESKLDNLDIPTKFRRKYAISKVKVVLEGICEDCLKQGR